LSGVLQRNQDSCVHQYVKNFQLLCARSRFGYISYCSYTKHSVLTNKLKGYVFPYLYAVFECMYEIGNCLAFTMIFVWKIFPSTDLLFMGVLFPVCLQILHLLTTCFHKRLVATAYKLHERIKQFNLRFRVPT
jgi:hypothetical protein